ncbi:MAG: carboxypeptidase regulatory-like domain-containing protein [Solirubrobacterales bacterium]|jgi:cytochrome c5
MILRKPFALLAAGSLSLFACGGDSTQSTPAASTAAPEAKSAAPAAAAGSAAVSGKIAFEGTVPAAEKVKLNADPKCAAMHKDGLERWQLHVKDGGLADVLVYVKSGFKGTVPPPTEPALLDQKGCDYHPHMLAMRAGQPLKIRNSDDTLHNIHPRPQANPEFNMGQARQGMEATRQFDKAEVMIPVGCDVHPWMRAYISVFEHPFFTVSKEDGSFEIKGLPAGEYEIEAFHGKLKGQAQKVTVKDGESATLNFTFKG